MVDTVGPMLMPTLHFVFNGNMKLYPYPPTVHAHKYADLFVTFCCTTVQNIVHKQVSE